jgi:hypothetical protein
LTMNGVLTEGTQGAASLYRFALDRMAESIGAEAIVDDPGVDGEKWEEVLQASEAPGFRTALRLTRQAYGLSRGSNMEDI